MSIEDRSATPRVNWQAEVPAMAKRQVDAVVRTAQHYEPADVAQIGRAPGLFDGRDVHSSIEGTLRPRDHVDGGCAGARFDHLNCILDLLRPEVSVAASLVLFCPRKICAASAVRIPRCDAQRCADRPRRYSAQPLICSIQVQSFLVTGSSSFDWESKTAGRAGRSRAMLATH